MRLWASKPFAVAVLVLLARPCFAEENANRQIPDRLTASDIFNLQFAADPRISPDGKSIVYVRRMADVTSDKRVSNLWVLRFDGSEDRPVTTGTSSDGSPRWSPDGTRIAYVSDRDGKPQLYVRWMDTGETARLTDLEYPPHDIAWSPDGRRISFASHVPSQELSIATLPKAPKGATWADPPRAYDRLE